MAGPASPSSAACRRGVRVALGQRVTAVKRGDPAERGGRRAVRHASAARLSKELQTERRAVRFSDRDGELRRDDDCPANDHGAQPAPAPARDISGGDLAMIGGQQTRRWPAVSPCGREASTIACARKRIQSAAGPASVGRACRQAWPPASARRAASASFSSRAFTAIALAPPRTPLASTEIHARRPLPSPARARFSRASRATPAKVPAALLASLARSANEGAAGLHGWRYRGERSCALSSMLRTRPARLRAELASSRPPSGFSCSRTAS